MLEFPITKDLAFKNKSFNTIYIPIIYIANGYMRRSVVLASFYKKVFELK